GGGDGDADEPLAGGAVEVARRHQDAAVGEVGDRVPAGLVPGGPQVQARLAVLDAEAVAGQCPAQGGASGRVAFALDADVLVVAQGRRGGGLAGRRGHHAAVLADLEQGPEDRRVTGQEGG